jgi:hypothetical protein
MQFEGPTRKLGRKKRFHDDVVSLALIIKNKINLISSVFTKERQQFPYLYSLE